MSWYMYGGRPNLSAAERRRRAARTVREMTKAGRDVSPVEIAGRKIASTFWGGAWCENLESYSDYSNRLPRGRTYVRNGSVVDLQIAPGRVRSLVSGRDMYEVEVEIAPLAPARWADIKRRCGGKIGSLVELLQGSISKGVMEIVTRKEGGLFPSPAEIRLGCSCPDWAILCKHVAATLYGVGARLDQRPELLFTLRGVEPAEMIAAAIDQPAPGARSRSRHVLASDELSSVFGIDLEMSEAPPADGPARAEPRRRAARAKKKTPTREGSVTETAAKEGPTARGPHTKKKTAKKKTATKKTATKKTATKKTATKKTATKQRAR